MKKLFYFVAVAACATMFVSCGQENDIKSDKEEALQKAMAPYVENTVIATYGGMATEGLKLYAVCEQILDAVDAGTDYTELMKQAGEAWIGMRKYWEQSEAFLYGPAKNHTIDPHIDSWPLDYNAMNSLLANADQMAQIEEEGGAYVGDKLGYALKGFHAAEYLLFAEGHAHACDLTRPQAVYLLGIVEDLAQQAILLEDSWAGGVSEEKEEFITDDEGESMSFDENYGSYLINAGKAGSIFVSYQAAAEEIIAGCVDIAGEVASLKLGNPYLSSNDEQREYIESPYSYNSVEDFADNIRSIEHAYFGAKAGDASISDYVKSKDADLDAKIRAAVDESIALILKIQDFETNAKGNTDVKAAIDKVRELEELLDDEVLALLAK